MTTNCQWHSLFIPIFVEFVHRKGQPVSENITCNAAETVSIIRCQHDSEILRVDDMENRLFVAYKKLSDLPYEKQIVYLNDLCEFVYRYQNGCFFALFNRDNINELLTTIEVLTGIKI